VTDPISLLTELALTPVAELDGFVARHPAAPLVSDPARIADAKALLDAIGAALGQPGDPSQWARLRKAREALADGSSPAEAQGTGTMTLEGAPAGGATLPFAAARTVATAPAASAPRDRPWSTGTVATGDAHPAAALPFGEHELTLEQYAALCAETALDVAHTAEINARHGLGAPGARGRVDLAWQKRLAADGALRQRWRMLFDELKRRG
jgi:hypothetical protein